MTLGLYKVGENQPIIRLRHGRTSRGRRLHLVPDCGPSVVAQQKALCGAELYRGEVWGWSDDSDECKPCQSVASYELRKGTMIIADPAVVATFQRTQLASLGDRQTAAAEQARTEARLAVEIYRPRDGVMGSVGTRREIHLVDCPIVSAVERPMVPLPVSEVLRLKNADSGRTNFCQECKPFHVLDNERRVPKSQKAAEQLSTQLGYRARQEAARKGVRAVRPSGGGDAFSGASEAAGDAWYSAGCPSTAAMALGELCFDGSEHYPDCPAEPDELLHGDVTNPAYGRCSCYSTDSDEQRPGDHGWGTESPEWTL
jgi:hypothetical protein